MTLHPDHQIHSQTQPNSKFHTHTNTLAECFTQNQYRSSALRTCSVQQLFKADKQHCYRYYPTGTIRQPHGIVRALISLASDITVESGDGCWRNIRSRQVLLHIIRRQPLENIVLREHLTVVFCQEKRFLHTSFCELFLNEGSSLQPQMSAARAETSIRNSYNISSVMFPS